MVCCTRILYGSNHQFWCYIQLVSSIERLQTLTDHPLLGVTKKERGEGGESIGRA
jgi:hypothetical protein